MTNSLHFGCLDCIAARARLQTWALGEIAPREAAAVERHLLVCHGCRTRAIELREMFAALPQALEPLRPPLEVLLGVLARTRGTGRARARWWMGFAAAAAALVAALLLRPAEATSTARALESPEIAVVNLFAAIDSPISSVYEYRTEAVVQFDRSVGRLLVNIATGEWQLVVHGLPRPPRGARYELSSRIADEERRLGSIERWEDGVAVLAGASDFDLARTERIWLELVSPRSRLRLLDSIDGAW
ncbi:MAG TPA: zf-HC2 domain-containing protein [Myxococcota bacterium]|nr:zf-HC2 domain-containing protein [Myxococcota bacterium]